MAVSEEDERVQRSGFALLKGEHLEYFVRKYTVELGRKSKSATLDVVLGDNMNLSRQHAQILYDFEKGYWCLSVLGKNGCQLNGRHMQPPESCPLASQDMISMGEQTFWFLLPRKNDKPGTAKGGSSKRKSAAPAKARSQEGAAPKRRAPSKPAAASQPAAWHGTSDTAEPHLPNPMRMQGNPHGHDPQLANGSGKDQSDDEDAAEYDDQDEFENPDGSHDHPSDAHPQNNWGAHVLPKPPLQANTAHRGSSASLQGLHSGNAQQQHAES